MINPVATYITFKMAAFVFPFKIIVDIPEMALIKKGKIGG